MIMSISKPDRQKEINSDDEFNITYLEQILIKLHNLGLEYFRPRLLGQRRGFHGHECSNSLFIGYYDMAPYL